MAVLGHSINGFLAGVEQVLFGATEADKKLAVVTDVLAVDMAVLEVGEGEGESAELRIVETRGDFASRLGWTDEAADRSLESAPRLPAPDAASLVREALEAIRSG